MLFLEALWGFSQCSEVAVKVCRASPEALSSPNLTPTVDPSSVGTNLNPPKFFLESKIPPRNVFFV